MKIAILSAGQDHRKDRGYENASRNLFENLLNEENSNLKVFLFKGSGIESDREIVLNRFISISILHKYGLKLLNDYYGLEYLQFALLFILHTIKKQLVFDTIYTKEPRVAKTLYQLRKFIPGKPTLVYGMGINLTPEHYINISDKVHFVNVEHYKEAKNAYPASEKFLLIPNPISENKVYSGNRSKAELRREYNIKTSKVLLSVGAINSGVKRMDYVIKEASKLNETWTLVICGKTQDQKIIELGKKLLGERFIHILLPPNKVPEIYALADLFVLSSLIEGFGNVTVEATQNCLPVLIHKRELNEWIVEDDDLLVDMTIDGALAEKIRESATDEWLLTKGQTLYSLYNRKYKWQALKPKYFDLLNVK